MSNSLHPVMQAAIAPFVIPVTPIKAVKRPKSTETFHYSLNGVDLVCELDYSAGESQTWEHPGSAESADLCEAFHRGEDIFFILSSDQCEEIETAFLEQDRSMDDSDPPEDESMEELFG